MRKLLVYRLVWLVPYPQKSLRRVFQLCRRAGVYSTQIMYESVPENTYEDIFIQIGEGAFQITVPDILYPALCVVQIFLGQRGINNDFQIIAKKTQNNNCDEGDNNIFNHGIIIAKVFLA